MNKTVPTTIGLLVALIAGMLAYAAMQPNTFRVKRSLRIVATPERLYPLINDLHAFNRWNPYLKKDPALKGSFAGASSGPGAIYHWEGNREVGKGSMEITGGVPNQLVTVRLVMLEPFAGENTVEFSLEPQGSATEVTWAMHGPTAFIPKLMGLFFDMDRMIGSDFETGLAQLKTLAEQP
jgi:hypothetical protein